MTDSRPDLQPNPKQVGCELREIDSRELMRGEREIVIRHGAEAYRLSVTRAGKLILRK
jgi:hemin uptake protein HemP